ncbi:hypothetical protein J437_LFUL012822 [Ladona fulva]|uniref:Uncharacterized protein n=1 Tax=Ladona fulva TaxID=123851 RepID=A0A8K0KJV8_LADFU|nr:hypothetical protein J437_LFUL012822 [Ladona fulva]
MGYSYNLHFKPTAKHANADGLPRLPIQQNMDEDVFDIGEDQITEFSARKVAVTTRRDKLLCQVLRAMNSDWPNPIEKKLEPFHKRERDSRPASGSVYRPASGNVWSPSTDGPRKLISLSSNGLNPTWVGGPPPVLP